MIPARFVWLALLLFSTSAVAEKQFYQIVEPGGRVRTIEYPSAPDAPPATSVQTLPVPPSRPSVAKLPAAPKTLEGEEYMDSEQLERQGFNPQKKKRFFVLKGVMGTQIEESLSDDADAPLAPLLKVDVPELFESLPDRFEMLPADGETATRLSLASRCLSAERRASAQPLLEGAQERSVSFDKKARQFVKAGDVVAAFVLTPAVGELVVTSYSSRSKSPGFVEPLVAFAGSDGCATRLVSGYFSRRYPATNSRHQRLEGRITLLPDEHFVLFVMPASTPAEQDFPVSDTGQIGMKWRLLL
ncbi:MAG: hypothetical protein Q8J78_11975 [Moraxellaceae bacterium]|nr:hypothetical protein [Moraxellaceae bacterium]